ncbi:TAXI family TRAP transporter solute-binding subunit [Aeromicrobium ponti]|uniref:C4-dicarboxylate ABC transporter substrate-binding protein n=1 Tax=Cytobacillus oceanisediminis TaxID=665099 RepID=A0A562JRB5_9BACI|nr:TAXI family TRAP transporter solute-binding subunit [Cytobacillus oceanisediminis]TWH85709.1 hypothetical protein IQ19_03134 [Cytobacillus oceanisediminis]
MLKKGISLLLTFSLVTGILSACASNETNQNGVAQGDSKPEAFIKIATGNTGGTYYPVGVAMGQLLSDKLDYVTSSAMSTGGSVDNIGLLRSNEAQVGILTAAVTNDAFFGEGEFKENKYENVRAITSMWPSLQHIVVQKDIKSFEDLKGKKFVVGAARSGTELDAHAILASMGLFYRDEYGTKKNMEPVYVNYEEAAEAMKNKQVAGGLFNSAPPGSAIADLMATGDFHILSFTEEEMVKLSKEYPLFTAYTIEPGIYPNLNEEVVAPGYPAVLVTSSDMDKEVIYDLTKTIFENVATLENAHKAAQHIRAETATKGIQIEFHEGTKQYLEEKGLWKK